MSEILLFLQESCPLKLWIVKSLKLTIQTLNPGILIRLQEVKLLDSVIFNKTEFGYILF